MIDLAYFDGRDGHYLEREDLDVGHTVRVMEGMASGQTATVIFVYARHMGSDAYCTIVTESGERHFEPVRCLMKVA